MDYIDGLAISQGKSAIMVVVDRLSKYSHFLPIAHPYTAVSVAQIFLTIFICGFWTELFRLNGTSFNFSSAYHPQTDVQSEMVNKTLEMYLHCFTSAKPKQWVKWLSWAEFCYNTSWHSTIQ